jgi:glycosyltransferase involved in cell wall biosynthesis
MVALHISYATRVSIYNLEVVVPAFDKADEISIALGRICETLRPLGVTFRVHVVFDGPDPVGLKRVAEANIPEVTIHQLARQNGKGFTVRYGVEQTISEYVAYIDGDLDLDPISLVEGYQILSQSHDKKLACLYGSKFHQSSTVNYPFKRKVLSHGYRLLTWLLVGVRVEDSQTGLKLYRRDALLDAIEYSKEDRFLFDLEIFVLLKNLGFTFIAIPVHLEYKYSSSIGLRSVAIMFLDTITLAWRMSRKRIQKSVE